MKNKLLRFFEVKKLRDKNTNCDYIFIRIKKHISKNQILCPRLKFTNFDFENSTSIYDFMQNENSLLGINAGIFNVATHIPECVVVKDKKVYFDCKETYIHVNPWDGEEKRDVLYILGIKENGDLKMYPPVFTAEQIVEDGCKDAVMGFVPLIVDYESFEGGDELVPHGSYKRKQRQVIGQFENKDYFVITILQDGMTFEETRNLLKRHKVSFAYALDNGSSTQTVFNKQRLTPVYRDETGRRVPTAITFDVEEKLN